MIRSNSGALAIIVAAAAISGGSPASAADVVVEAPLAMRVVHVSNADLASPDRLAALHGRIRAAVGAACREEYGNSTGVTYHYPRACHSRGLRDALGQLREIQKRQLARDSQVDAQVAISIRPR